MVQVSDSLFFLLSPSPFLPSCCLLACCLLACCLTSPQRPSPPFAFCPSLPPGHPPLPSPPPPPWPIPPYCMIQRSCICKCGAAKMGPTNKLLYCTPYCKELRLIKLSTLPTYSNRESSVVTLKFSFSKHIQLFCHFRICPLGLV